MAEPPDACLPLTGYVPASAEHNGIIGLARNPRTVFRLLPSLSLSFWSAGARERGGARAPGHGGARARERASAGGAGGAGGTGSAGRAGGAQEAWSDPF